MATKTFLTILLCAIFFSLSAQNATPRATENRPLAFESVSFATVQGSITITCEEADKLTDFEFIGQDDHIAFSWDFKHPANHFPMKLGIKPGQFTIKYKMRDGETKTIQLKVEAREEVKLTL